MEGLEGIFRRPAIAQHGLSRVEVLSNLLQLIAPEQMYVLLIDTQEEADVTLPTGWVFARKNHDAPRNRLRQWLALFEP